MFLNWYCGCVVLWVWYFALQYMSRHPSYKGILSRRCSRSVLTSMIGNSSIQRQKKRKKKEGFHYLDQPSSSVYRKRKRKKSNYHTLKIINILYINDVLYYLTVNIEFLLNKNGSWLGRIECIASTKSVNLTGRGLVLVGISVLVLLYLLARSDAMYSRMGAARILGL